MPFQRIHHPSRSRSSQAPWSTSQFAPRPFPIQEAKHPPTQEELADRDFQQNKLESTELQLKEKHGTIKPLEQERLGVLQAKMDRFWEQRMEAAKAQPNLLKTLAPSAAPIQRVPIDQEELIDIYHDDSDFNATIRKLDGVEIVEEKGLLFNDGHQVTPKTSFATTLPHEKPPVIFINETKHTNQKHLATTLYHEVQHAYDTSFHPKEDSSEAALRQDFVSEAETLRKEGLRGLARGDEETIDLLIKDGILKGTVENPELNEEYYEQVASGDYSNYGAVPRSVRFSRVNYTPVSTVATYEPGSWQKIIDTGYEADTES